MAQNRHFWLAVYNYRGTGSWTLLLSQLVKFVSQDLGPVFPQQINLPLI